MASDILCVAVEVVEIPVFVGGCNVLYWLLGLRGNCVGNCVVNEMR